MLTTIHITVRNRVPTITAGEDVISHNSDYAAEYEFDEEWQDKVKTVYFVCEDGSYQAVVMDGNSCDVPMMAGEHRRIFVGVQEGTSVKPGKLKTTRPCCLKVKDSIADYLGQPIPDPTPDVYEQIIAMLNNLTTPTWDAVQNKPFSTLGNGLEVDENGVLSVPEGGSADNVRIIDATDAIWENGEHPLNMTTEEYQNILEWYRNQQSGVAKNILLNIDNRLVFQLVYIDGVGMTFIYSNSGYNRYIKVSRRSNEVIATTSDIAGLTKSLMEASYLCNTGHKDDIIALFNMTTVGVIRGAGDSVPDNGKSIRYPALVFFGDEISYGNTYATLIDRNGVMWSIYIRLGSGVIKLGEKTDYVTNAALTDILQGYARQENLVEFSEGVANSLDQKLDKNQGADNAGKILGVGEDGIVVPQDKPTGGSVTVDDALSSTSKNPVQNMVVTAALAEKITAPTTAAVGQIIKVKSVDSAGKPTEWEAADMPSGGSVTDEQVNTAVSAWLTEHPEATTTVADGSITPEKLADADYLWQIFNPSEFLAGVTNATINTNTGAVNPYNDTRYRVSPFIAADFDTYAVRIPYAEVGLNKNYDRIGTLCCYDADYAFLGVATTPEWNDDGKTWNATFTTVEGTKYIRFSANGVNIASAWTEGYIESIVICKGGVIYPYYFVGKIAIWDKISIADSARDNTIDGKKLLDNSIEGVKFKDLSVTKDKIAEVSPEVIYGCDFKNLFDKELYDLAGRVTTHYIRGGWLNSSGALSDAVNALGSWVTLFIPCYPNTTYALYAFNDAGETTTSYFRNYISYRDKTSKKVIEAVAVGEAVITPPADTYYICVTLTVNDQALQQKIINRMMLVKANEVLTSYYPYMVRPHWLKTDNFADGTQIICYGDSLTQNKYPSKLASLLGVLVTDAGVGGNTIAQIYNRVGNYGTNYSIVTLMVGTNDNGGQTSCPLGTIDDEAATDDNATDTSTSYVSRLKRLINKIKITHPGVTYVIMPPFEHTWSNFSGLADVMRQVAELYSIPFLDIFHLCGFRGTDTTDAALYLSDGTHENDLGAQRIAELLAGFIKQLKGA